eukprot:TRINITY_DN27009_c0_g1_i1.p5 TRINITY_DN27009_c0_g1~~TRINITY_DN27009_c0_g1_i1.p5  ORF type:complete len:53 (+),score=9.73 TRINITY_DN27009_c0_g1_i1:116-274(+)
MYTSYPFFPPKIARPAAAAAPTAMAAITPAPRPAASSTVNPKIWVHLSFSWT